MRVAEFLHNNPLARHTRRAMVDLGFGRFLEMFEERFGKALTTIFLTIIALGVASVCVSEIVTIIVLPLYTWLVILIKIPGWKISISAIPAIITAIVTIALIGSLNYFFFKWQFNWRSRLVIEFNKTFAETEASKVRAAENMEDARKLQTATMEMLAEASAAFEEYELKVIQLHARQSQDRDASEEKRGGESPSR